MMKIKNVYWKLTLMWGGAFFGLYFLPEYWQKELADIFLVGVCVTIGQQVIRDMIKEEIKSKDSPSP